MKRRTLDIIFAAGGIVFAAILAVLGYFVFSQYQFAQDYVKNELKWESDLHYPSSGNVRPWTYDQNRYMDMTEPLRSAMTHNPFLKVFVAIGYYDMATIMGGAEFNFTHLAYDKPIVDRVSYGYYEAGHMIYIRPSAHKALKNDVAKFIAGTRAPTPPRATTQQ